MYTKINILIALLCDVINPGHCYTRTSKEQSNVHSIP